ncbi:hypothetical protein PSAB6_270027 [Paraburkholderia sabiae]|nr:hypothetical protein PSAB6_270027 [Paraburkholderia sabiae]
MQLRDSHESGLGIAQIAVRLCYLLDGRLRFPHIGRNLKQKVVRLVSQLRFSELCVARPNLQGVLYPVVDQTSKIRFDEIGQTHVFSRLSSDRQRIGN